jgi:hypothetical protein
VRLPWLGRFNNLAGGALWAGNAGLALVALLAAIAPRAVWANLANGPDLALLALPADDRLAVLARRTANQERSQADSQR